MCKNRRIIHKKLFMVYNLYTVKLERPKVVRYEHKYEGLYHMFSLLVRGVYYVYVIIDATIRFV